jgi:hypothetical protein
MFRSVDRFRLITSPLAPPGTAYIVDMAALETFEAPISFTSEPEWSKPFDAAQFTAMAELRASFQPTEVERDPMERGPQHTPRALWRQMRAVFGYEWRKATGRQRRYPRQRHAIITGLTA